VKISYVSGVCVINDAISNSVRDEIFWLRSEGGHDVRLFTYECTHQDVPFEEVSDLSDVVFNRHFQSSDLIVYHFGVFFPLFDSIFLSPVKAKRLVVFHNITPREYVAAENRPTIDRSYRQLSNIAFADHVACASQTNLDVLRLNGLSTPAKVLPLAFHCGISIPTFKPSWQDGLVRIVFIGRFVRSKGPGELLDALVRVLDHFASFRLSVDLIGNVAFSDVSLMKDLEFTIGRIHARFGVRIKISIHGDASESDKLNRLNDADLFVLPTYHEGFCVPILEAYSRGCRVITYENSNTPFISGGFASLVPTGDVSKLSSAIAVVISDVLSPSWRGSGPASYASYSDQLVSYLKNFSLDRSKHRFLSFLKRVF
jgi:glycosyltransferase involved in cell wall biosynthesis